VHGGGIQAPATGNTKGSDQVASRGKQLMSINPVIEQMLARLKPTTGRLSCRRACRSF